MRRSSNIEVFTSILRFGIQARFPGALHESIISASRDTRLRLLHNATVLYNPRKVLQQRPRSTSGVGVCAPLGAPWPLGESKNGLRHGVFASECTKLLFFTGDPAPQAFRQTRASLRFPGFPQNPGRRKCCKTRYFFAPSWENPMTCAIFGPPHALHQKDDNLLRHK